MKKIYSKRVWEMDTSKKNIYLTFDDGPHPEATVFVLKQLAEYNAKATFFCIGKNVMKEPGLYRQIIEQGHATGNHTHDHLNGWKTPVKDYSANVKKAAEVISTNLFRPPYGRIRSEQVGQLSGAMNIKSPKLIMWTVLSGDFDLKIEKQKCVDNVISNARAGSIIVFHDSQKAFPRLEFALPAVLKYFHENGYGFRSIRNT